MKNLKKIGELEFHVMAPYHRVGAIKKVDTGPGWCLNGHRHSFYLDNQRVCNELPRKPDDSLYKIVLAGCWTSAEVNDILKPHLVDPKNLQHNFDISHRFENKYFADISYSNDNSALYNPKKVHSSFVMDLGYNIDEKKYEKKNIKDDKEIDNSDKSLGGNNIVHDVADSKDATVWFTTADNTHKKKNQ